MDNKEAIELSWRVRDKDDKANLRWCTRASPGFGDNSAYLVVIIVYCLDQAFQLLCKTETQQPWEGRVPTVGTGARSSLSPDILTPRWGSLSDPFKTQLLQCSKSNKGNLMMTLSLGIWGEGTIPRRPVLGLHKCTWLCWAQKEATGVQFCRQHTSKAICGPTLTSSKSQGEARLCWPIDTSGYRGFTMKFLSREGWGHYYKGSER